MVYFKTKVIMPIFVERSSTIEYYRQLPPKKILEMIVSQLAQFTRNFTITILQ
jgi:hypothetical protein